MMHTTQTLRICLVGAMALAACSKRTVHNTGQASYSLQPFENCTELEDYLKDTAAEAIERQLSGYGYGWGWGWAEAQGRGDVALEASADGAAEGAPNDDSAGSTGGLTGTNNQEANVDEADFVKTDDEFIYVLHGNSLQIVRAFPADSAEVISQTELEGYPSQLFVEGDLAVVFSSVPGEQKEVSGDYYYYYYWPTRLGVTVLDVSDRTDPKIVRQSLLDGTYVGARMVNGSVRLVSRWGAPLEIDYNIDFDQPYPEYPDCYDYYYYDMPSCVCPTQEEGAEPVDCGCSDPVEPPADEDIAACEAEWEEFNQAAMDWQKAYTDALIEHNMSRVDEMTLDHLLPTIDTTIGGETTVQRISACTDFYRSELDAGFGLVSVSTIDLEQPETVLGATTVLGDHGILYASQDQLYLAMTHYAVWDWSEEPPKDEVLLHTAIHQFDIGSDRNKAPYVASGQVPGFVNDQFSMDEYDNQLRIATTIDMWGADFNTQRSSTFSVLVPESGLLETVGSIEGIAPDEQIMAARLFDDRGYLVTFRQIDPLFAIDLSDPRNPTIVGELEITGFSEYVHPLGDNHLLTVGTAANEDGGWLGSQLSIFDVTDMKNPQLVHNEFLGQGQSEAQYDHKALTFKETGDARGILALPMQDWSSYDSGARLLVYDVDSEDGFASRGAISHSDLFVNASDYYCYWQAVRRGVLSEDHVYSISTAGFKVSDLESPEQTVASGSFGQADLCGYYYGDGGPVGIGGGGVAVEGDDAVDSGGGAEQAPAR